MKTLIRVAFTVLSLSFGMAHAATTAQSPAQQSGGYNFMAGGGG